MFNLKLFKNVDFGLIVLVLILFAVGLVIVASATDVNLDGMNRKMMIQIFAFVIGTIFAVVVMMIDYRFMGDLQKVFYVLSILVMLTVFIPGLGVRQYGAQSWIDLKIMYFQPAEIAKLGFILSFAKYLEKKGGRVSSVRDILGIVLFVLPFIGILLVQPDLGMALVFVFITIGMVYAAGIDFKLVVASLIAMVVGMPVAYQVMQPHQRIRIDAFLHPEDLSLPGNYHVMQSKITIGSGQLFGKGLFEGAYHRSDYLPVKESDFIFAVLSEETGFVGGAFVIALYFFFLSRLITMAKKSKDFFGELVIVGITFMFAFQIIENIGMTIGLMPVTGITLPFLSYGGSSVMTSMMAVGLALNVYMRRKRSSFNQ
jgi:rod shape determining protein RodA